MGGGRLTYANVMSTLAVFLALAGGSFAIGAALSKNSVKSKQVKNESLTAKDLKDAKAVGSAEIVDGSVATGDLAPGGARHVVGGADEPTFGNGDDGDCIWASGTSFIPNVEPPSFYRDVTGTVHLRGVALSLNGPQGDGACDLGSLPEMVEDFRVFTLPPGFRPDHLVEQSTIVSAPGNDIGTILIGSDENSDFSGATVPAGAVLVPANAPVANGTVLNAAFRAADAEPRRAPAPTRAARDRPLRGELGPLGH